MKNTEDDEIFASWRLYQKIIKYNYMFHKEMYTSLLKALPRKRELSVLDLGCGDAFAIVKALEALDISSYVGIDLSADAVKHAKENLKMLDCSTELITGDFLAELSKLEKCFDVIIAGYSIHHLEKDDTQLLFSEVKKRLNINGHFLYYDEMREERESQDIYIEKLWKTAEEEWTTLTEKEFGMLREHIFHHDYPLSFTELDSISKESNFKKSEYYFRDESKLFVFIDFQ